MKSIKIILSLLLAISLFIPFSKAEAASTKTAYVDIESGLLNIRSGPGTNYKKVGLLKNKSKVTVYYQTKTGWAEIRYNNKKAYVSNEFLRFYLKMSQSTARKINIKAHDVQNLIKSDPHTKKQIYSILSPYFTKSFIDRYFKDSMEVYYKDKNGTPYYGGKGIDGGQYTIIYFGWEPDSYTKKPTIKYYKKGEKYYLMIRQYINSEVSDNYTMSLYLIKNSSKSNWKVYNSKRDYHN